MSVLRNCDWCGKETYSRYCSTKCQVEHDSHRGISPAQRSKMDKETMGCGWGCTFLIGIIWLVLYASWMQKNTSSESARPSSRYKESYGTYANKKDDSWVCKYCGYVPSQTDGLTCYSAKDPYLHKWIKR